MYAHAGHVACCQNLAETHDAKLDAWQKYILETMPDLCSRHAITNFAIFVLLQAYSLCMGGLFLATDLILPGCYLDKRCQAVGCARCVGDDVI